MGPASQTAASEMAGVFEQARLAALSNGVNSYVGFATDADSAIPAQAQYRDYIIFRDRTEDEPATPAYVQLTKWRELPKGISFKSDVGILNLQETPATFTGLTVPGGGSSNGGLKLPVVEFTSTGAVYTPTNDLYVYLYGGYRSNGQDQLTPAKQPMLNRLTLSHYTGRIQADVVDPATVLQ